MSLPNLPFYKQTPPMDAITLSTSLSIRPNRGYFQIRFVDMRLARDFIVGTSLVPTLHAIFEIERLTSLNEVIIGPELAQDSKKGDNRRVYIAPQMLTPIIPNDGRKIKGQLGLFSVPDRDLISEMLGFLKAFTNPKLSPELTAAFEISDMVRQGINALLMLDDTKMTLGWKGEIENEEELRQQYIIITSPSSEMVDKSKIKIINGRLHYDGQTLDKINYLVFAVMVANKRHDWHILPEIRPFYDEWNRMRSLHNPPMQEYNDSLSKLLTSLRNSHNIVAYDAERIAKEEISPLLKLGDAAQNALFRTAGFDLPSKVETDESIIDDFIEVDVSGDSGENV